MGVDLTVLLAIGRTTVVARLWIAQPGRAELRRHWGRFSARVARTCCLRRIRKGRR
jgi:hypothetical protein